MRYGTTQLLVIGQKGEIRFVGGAPIGLSCLTVSQLDRSALDLVHPEDRPSVARELAGVLSAPGRMVTTQLRVNNVDGREAWATCQAINRMDGLSISRPVTFWASKPRTLGPSHPRLVGADRVP